MVKPTIDEDEDTDIIDYLALPSLHLTLGPFNKLWDVLVEIAPEINEVAKVLGTVRDDYFGGNFEGNETKKLLKNTDMIRKVLNENLHIFVDFMESLQAVRKPCFGFTLDQNYKECISFF